MKVPVEWLYQYVKPNCGLTELCDKLTMAGLEVEAVEKAETPDQAILDIKITPNRGDCLSMLGMAREVAALFCAKLEKPDVAQTPGKPGEQSPVKISIKDPDLCRRYVGCVLKGVKVKTSPDWMQRRLTEAGLRPINNVVDVTNYVMLEFGQPLHAFDYTLLQGSEIIVRRAAPGEKVTTIDGEDRPLEPDMLVIADANIPVAVAGVMGGAESEIGENTTDIMLESANFKDSSIRRTAKRLGMGTDASYRFERGVDPNVCLDAAMRAAGLMLETGGGEMVGGFVDVYPGKVDPIDVTVRPERTCAILGCDISAEEMVDILNRLNIETVLKEGKLQCQVPTFRTDITREIDLIEEIGIMHGFEKMPMTLPQGASQGKDSPQGTLMRKLRRILMSSGLQETLTHGMVDKRLVDLCGEECKPVIIRNPLSEELNSMRVSLIPGLLQIIERNQSFGTNDVSVFEIARIYRQTSGGIDERLSVCGAMVGSMWGSSWGRPAQALDVDFYVAKGVLENLCSELAVKDVRFERANHPLLHPSRTAKVSAGGVELGVTGEVSPAVREKMDLRGRPCVFELDFEALRSAASSQRTYLEAPRFPASYRHMSVLVGDEPPYEQIEAVVSASADYLSDVRLLDVYKGKNVDPGKRSLTIAVSFRSADRTLTDEEANAELEKIKSALVEKCGAQFRS